MSRNLLASERARKRDTSCREGLGRGASDLSVRCPGGCGKESSLLSLSLLKLGSLRTRGAWRDCMSGCGSRELLHCTGAGGHHYTETLIKPRGLGWMPCVRVVLRITRDTGKQLVLPILEVTWAERLSRTWEPRRMKSYRPSPKPAPASSPSVSLCAPPLCKRIWRSFRFNLLIPLSLPHTCPSC